MLDPAPPVRLSLPTPETSVSSPLPPLTTVTLAKLRPPTMVSLPSPPFTVPLSPETSVSSPPAPLMVSRLSVPGGWGLTSGVPGGAEPAIVFGPPLPVRVSLPLPPVRPSTSAAMVSFSPACPLPVDAKPPVGSVAVTGDVRVMLAAAMPT